MVKLKYHSMMLQYFFILYKSCKDSQLKENFSKKIDYHEHKIQLLQTKVVRQRAYSIE
jgi:hypothetical protein